jgi:hypothetical protein
MNLFEYIKLYEGSGNYKLYHYTSIGSLNDILKDGEITGFVYDPMGSNEYAIATVRPSMKSLKDELSGNSSGGIKFIFDTKKLLNTNRRTKIKPIAEFPSNGISYYKLTYGDEDNPRIRSIFKKLAAKGFDKKNIRSNDLLDAMSEEDRKYIKNNVEDYKKGLSQFFFAWTVAYRNKTPKEGEERIVLKDKRKRSLPLNPKYVKIKIEPNRVLNKHLENLRQITKNNIYENIKKNANLFIQDENYKNLLKILKGKQ